MSYKCRCCDSVETPTHSINEDGERLCVECVDAGALCNCVYDDHDYRIVICPDCIDRGNIWET